MPKREKLLPCPFCGAAAKAKKQQPSPPELDDAWWTIECSHATEAHYKRGTGCPVMPMATADSYTNAARCWNTRAHDGNKRPAFDPARVYEAAVAAGVENFSQADLDEFMETVKRLAQRGIIILPKAAKAVTHG